MPAPLADHPLNVAVCAGEGSSSSSTARIATGTGGDRSNDVLRQRLNERAGLRRAARLRRCRERSQPLPDRIKAVLRRLFVGLRVEGVEADAFQARPSPSAWK